MPAQTLTELDYIDYEQGLDVLSIKCPLKKSETFKVTFSFYKASPHLIILPYDTHRWRRFSDLQDSDQRELVRVGLELTQLFGLSNITLSIHLGNWVTRDGCFHGHICFGETNKNRYLEIFDAFKPLEPMSKFWPSEAYRFYKKSWRTRLATDLDEATPEDFDELHAVNVLEYPTFNWRMKDFPQILKVKKISSLVDFDEFPFDVRFHNSKPQIAIPWIAKTEEMKSVDRMFQYIKILESLALFIRDNLEHWGGCQICISTSGDGYPGFGCPAKDIQGYLHLSGDEFYKLCTRTKQQSWLQQYKTWDGRIYT